MTVDRQDLDKSGEGVITALVSGGHCALAFNPMSADWTIGKTWDGASLPSDEHINITVVQGGGDTLNLTIEAPFHNDPAPEAPVGSTWQLWDYEVVELFLVRNDGSYLEIELGPHGHYLVLDLSGPRKIRERHLSAEFIVRREAGRWWGHAEIKVPTPLGTIVRANAFAIHGRGDSRRFLAASPVPGAHPDFHQPETFPDVNFHS